MQAVFAQVDDGLQVAAGTPPVEVPGDILVLEQVLDDGPIAIQ